VGPEETLRKFTEDADEVVCLKVPYLLRAIGSFYVDFKQVEDSEVMEILRRSVKKGEGDEYRNA
jgi:predicted phosphoribosyltransferase